MKKIIRAFNIMILLILVPACLMALSATVSVDYNNDLTSYNYRRLLGNNTGVWLAPAGYTANKDKINAAGSYLLRFPGGSLSNEYHWNGTGSYDADNIWHADNTNYTKGFQGLIIHRGSTSAGYGNAARLTDGDTSALSQWVSETLTAASCTTNAYAGILFASGTNVDSIKIYWGDTYAVNYEIQYWNNSGNFGWAPHMANTSSWTTLTTVTGAAGGIETRSFPLTNSVAFRILMHTSSSAGYKINEIELYSGATKQTVNVNSTSQMPSFASPTSRANAPGGWTPDFDFKGYMDLIQSMGPKAIPACSVNFGNGTPEEAAAWVHYANIVKGYNIKYWEIGNEMDGVWEGGGPVDAEFYAKRFIDFATAMKAEDPSIKICGPVISSLQINSELYDGQSFLDSFFGVLQSAGKLGLVDVLDFHMYADWQNNIEANTLNTPSNWFGGSNYKSFIDNILIKYYGSAQAKDVYMSEHNTGNATIVTMGFASSLWAANWLMEYARAFGSRAHASLWDIMNNNASTGVYDMGFLEIGQQTGAYQYQERGTYWGMYMINNYLGVQDDNGNTLVSASSGQALLPVYACKRSDGKLSLMVINKDSANSYGSTINLSNYTPDPSAELYTFAANASAPYYIQNYMWHDANPSSYADPDVAPKENAIHTASNSFVFTFPPYSISVFNFVPLGSTPTITMTPANPTNTPTYTFTQTFTLTKTPAMTLTLTTPVTASATPTITATPGVTPLSAKSTLSNVYVSPSLFDSRKGDKGIWFYGLANRTILQIYSLTGELVYKTDQNTPDGTMYVKIEGIMKHHSIAPGIYVYIAADIRGNTKHGKFAVIR